MATSTGRGAQTMNTMYLKPMLRKAYHRKSNSPDMASESVKVNGEERKKKRVQDGNWWFPDDRTGIYYPKGQEKVIQDVPIRAAKDLGVNWFSDHGTVKP